MSILLLSLLSCVAIVSSQIDLKNGAIFALGGSGLSVSEMYLPTTNEWTPLPSMSGSRECLASVYLNGFVYAIGGYSVQAENVVSSIEALDTTSPNATWTSLASLNVARCGLSAVAMNGLIFVMGGHNGINWTFSSTVEKYNPTINKWILLNDMPTARTAAAAASLGGLIYLIGGMDKTSKALSRVDVYTPARDSWASVAPLTVPRMQLAAAASGSAIFAMGGTSSESDTGAPLKSVEMYNPYSDTWVAVAPMGTARRYFSAVTLNGLIFAVGGSNNDFTFLSTTEKYNPTSNTWATSANMETGRDELGLCAVQAAPQPAAGNAGSTDMPSWLIALISAICVTVAYFAVTLFLRWRNQHASYYAAVQPQPKHLYSGFTSRKRAF
jgi:hypothetical protein